MKKKRHKPEEIVRKLREAEALLAGGKSIEAVSREIGVSVPTYHRWKAEYGGATKDIVKQVKELKSENDRLKRLVADKELEIAIWKEVGSKKW
jgi:transposase-like protein